MKKYTITIRPFVGADLIIRYIPETDIVSIRDGLIRAIHNGTEFHYMNKDFAVIYPSSILQNGMITIEETKPR